MTAAISSGISGKSLNSSAGSPSTLPKYLIDSELGTYYVVAEFLGKGGFAICHRAVTFESGYSVALKIVPKQKLTKPHQWDKIKREISLQKPLRHRHIVRMYSAFEDNDHIYMSLEYCPKQSLMHYLYVMPGKRLNEPETRHFMLQLIEGVRYLHTEAKILHRDLKLGNLLLLYDPTVMQTFAQNGGINSYQDHCLPPETKCLMLKIADFGLAIGFEQDEILPNENNNTISPTRNSSNVKMGLCGTPNYVAPEILNNLGHSVATESWAVGCIMYAMLFGRPPFETNSIDLTYSLIVDCKYNLFDNHSIETQTVDKTYERVGLQARRLIAQFLHPEPQQRPKFNDKRAFLNLKMHLFFQSNHRPLDLQYFTNNPTFSSIFSNNGYYASSSVVKLHDQQPEGQCRTMTGIDVDSVVVNKRRRPPSYSPPHSAVILPSQHYTIGQSVYNEVFTTTSVTSGVETPSTPIYYNGSPTATTTTTTTAVAASSYHTTSQTPPMYHPAETTSLSSTQQNYDYLTTGMSHYDDVNPSSCPCLRQDYMSHKQQRCHRNQQIDVNCDKGVVDLTSPSSQPGHSSSSVFSHGDNGGPVRRQLYGLLRDMRRQLNAFVGYNFHDDSDDCETVSAHYFFDSLICPTASVYQDLLPNNCSVEIIGEKTGPFSGTQGPPPTLVTKWLDYTNRYGLGYTLADGSCCVRFNDGVSVCLDSTRCRWVRTWVPNRLLTSASDDDSMINFLFNYANANLISDLVARLPIVLEFANYMDRRLMDAIETNQDADLTSRYHRCCSVHQSPICRLPYLYLRRRFGDTVIFLFSDGTFQMNIMDGSHLKVVFRPRCLGPGSRTDFEGCMVRPTPMDYVITMKNLPIVQITDQNHNHQQDHNPNQEISTNQNQGTTGQALGVSSSNDIQRVMGTTCGNILNFSSIFNTLIQDYSSSFTTSPAVEIQQVVRHLLNMLNLTLDELRRPVINFL